MNKKLRVWHIPQIPCKAFYVNIDSIEEGKKIMDILSIYDQFQFQNKIKPDYSNTQGIEEYDEDSDGDGTPDWIEWYDEEDGIEIKEYCEENNIDFIEELISDNNIKF